MSRGQPVHGPSLARRGHDWLGGDSDTVTDRYSIVRVISFQVRLATSDRPDQDESSPSLVRG